MFIGIKVDSEGYCDGVEAQVICVGMNAESVIHTMYESYVREFQYAKEQELLDEDEEMETEYTFGMGIKSNITIQYPDHHVQYELKEI